MTKRPYQEIFIALTVFTLVLSCSRKGVPEGTTGGENLKQEQVQVDTFKYRYVLAEAEKQKLLGKMGDALGLFQQAVRINPYSDAAYYGIGNIAFILGDHAAARTNTMKALSIDSTNIWYYLQAAGIFYRQENFDSCTMMYERILNRWPERDDLALNLASIYMEAGKFRKALATYKKLDDKYDWNSKVHIGLYNVYVRLEQYELAEKEINRLMKKEPGNSNYLGLLAELYRREGKPEKARQMYDQLIEKDPDNKLAAISQIDFFLENGDFDLALEEAETFLFREGIEENQKIEVLAKLLEEESLIKTYSRLLLNLIEKFEEEYPDEFRIHLLKYEYHVSRGEKEKSITALEDFVRQNKTSYEVYEQLLFELNEAEAYHKLFIYGRTASTIFNRSPVLKILYAIGAYEEGAFDTAEEQLRKALIMAGENEALQQQIKTLQADVFYRQHKLKETFRVYEELLIQDPGNALVLNNYAYYLAENDTLPEKALELARRCIKQERKNPTYRDTYAWALYKNGKLRAAKRNMEQALAGESGNDPELLEHMGFILDALGDCREAIHYFQRALENGSENPERLREKIRECENKK